VRTATRYLLVVLLAVGAVAASCSDDDKVDAKDESSEDAGGSKTTDGDKEPAESDEVQVSCDEAATGELAVVEERGKPTISVPDPMPSELVVEDLVVGTGAEVVPKGAIEVHYVMTSADGTELDSSWEAGTPFPVPLEQVGEEFAGAVKGMKEGGRRQLVIPAEALFNGTYPDGVEADDMIIMVLDLVSVSEKAEDAAQEPKADEAALSAAEDRGEPKVTVPETPPTELVVIDDVEGTGDIVCAGDTVLAHYTGVDASSGEVFDSSWERGEPAAFGLDQVIQGWSEGLVGMKVGGRRTLVIPGAMAYGEDTTDSAGQPTGDLVFTVDMVGVG
jgi:peptidylprolyl isomerase